MSSQISFLDAFVGDISKTEEISQHVPKESCDVVLLIFVLSAMGYDVMKGVVQTCQHVLKKGGKVLIRDYAVNDATQHKFLETPSTRLLDGKLCVRGDGTQVYFFCETELKQLFCEFDTKTCLEIETEVSKQRKRFDFFS